MYKSILLLFLLVPLSIFSQTQKVSNLENVENQWLTLAKDWSYQKGDNIKWAQPNFDDSSWQVMTSLNLNMPNSKVIADKNEIVWFRKRIKIDSLVKDKIIFDIQQQGASEIYLDGKLIHKFGTVSSNPDDIINFNPVGAFQSLPLVEGKEQILAIRYVNGQYKYQKNQRFSNTNGYIQLWTTTLGNAKQTRLFSVTDSLLNNRWTTNARYWRHQIGDNPNWAKPDFDDTSWTQSSNVNLNIIDGEPIVDNNEIVWFRRPIKIDSTFTGATVLKIFQSGASEIYLDGKRIHKLGNVSTNPDSLVSYNPLKSLLSLPVIPGKEQQLAIRFATTTSKYPIYTPPFSGIVLNIASLDFAASNKPDIDFGVTERQNIINNSYIVLGIGVFMCVLFLCYFLFFPNEKINGYFALSSLFFSLAMYGIICDGDSFLFSLKYDLFISVSIALYLIILLFCIYKILNRKFGVFFWCVTIICLASIPLNFLFMEGYIGPALAFITLLEIIRISIKSLKSERIGALIFLSFSCVNLLYWLFLSLSNFDILHINKIHNYQPFAQVLVPLSIAIYLGYIFGKKSKSLRLNLERVQKLSKEKESILAKQNETLEVQVKERTASLNTSLTDLKATQSQLIQSEKLASLGQLAAGIAHEIKNPLNFVNNFSEINLELIEEINEELAKLGESPEKEEIKTILEDVVTNQKKIHQHGTRADSIVKSMLLHSRGGNGIKEPTDINAMLKEYVNLSFHAMRAGKKAINVSLDFQLDDAIPKPAVIMEDMSRVILNLCNNAFDAMHERVQNKTATENYQPKLTITTFEKNQQVVIEVEDNGLGIPQELKDKILMPFFTTKRGTEGTGLGLSITNDIIKAHGGTLQIDSKQGVDSFTKFIINLPN